MAYNIGVIGTGYVGLVTGTCFAATGNNVNCVDIDEEKINKLKNGILPIYEPGLDRMVERNVREGRLNFMTDLETAVKNSLIIFLCLPTPPQEDGSADLQHVLRVAGDIAKIMKENNITDNRIIIDKSTVPVGTSERVKAKFDDVLPGNENIFIVSNPEFLREGFAVEDSMKPERVVIGTSSSYVEEIMKDLYEPFVRSGNPIIIMDEKSAELTKYAANSFLAVKISFMNDLSAYCEQIGADVEKIRRGMGTDTRIGKRFLFAGIGYGGSCFPKDVRALMHSGEAAGTPQTIIQAAHKVNDFQSDRFIDRVFKRFGDDLSGKSFALWGIAFKPNTDDTREAPAFKIIQRLIDAGSTVKAYDPEAMANAKLRFGDNITYCTTANDCLPDTDALILATEWNIFRHPDFKLIKESLKAPIIFDGRNLYDHDTMEEYGFEYYPIGRRFVNSKI